MVQLLQLYLMHKTICHLRYQVWHPVVKALTGTAAKVFAVKKVVDFGKEAMSVSREFESGMAEVFTLLPDMSKSAMDNMSSDVKKFVKETGNTLNDTTSALYQAISAGVSKDDAILAGKEAIADKLTGNVVKEIYVPGRIINIVMK